MFGGPVAPLHVRGVCVAPHLQLSMPRGEDTLGYLAQCCVGVISPARAGDRGRPSQKPDPAVCLTHTHARTARASAVDFEGRTEAVAVCLGLCSHARATAKGHDMRLVQVDTLVENRDVVSEQDQAPRSIAYGSQTDRSAKGWFCRSREGCLRGSGRKQW